MYTSTWNEWAARGDFSGGIQSEEMLIEGVTDEDLKAFRFWLALGDWDYYGERAVSAVAIQPFLFTQQDVAMPFMVHLSSEASGSWRRMMPFIAEWWSNRGKRVAYGVDGDQPREYYEPEEE